MSEYNPALLPYLSSDKLRLVPREIWLGQMPLTVEALWMSRNFMAQVHKEKYGAIRISVNRTRKGIGRSFADGIHWDSLQMIKDVAGFSDFDAVEVYPKKSDIVNVANMRHLFVVKDKLKFAWRKNE